MPSHQNPGNAQSPDSSQTTHTFQPPDSPETDDSAKQTELSSDRVRSEEDNRALETKETGREVAQRGTRPEEPDVLLHVPTVKVDEITLEVDELAARVALHAAVGNLVALDVGADVSIGRVKLTIRGVEAQALLKVRLEQVYAILARTLTTIDKNPDILASLLKPVGEAVGAVGRTVERTVPELAKPLGETVGAVGRTVERTVPEIAAPLGQTVGAVGRTVEQTVPEVAQPVGETVGAVGRTVEQTVPEAARPVGETVGSVGKTVGAAAPGVVGAAGSGAGAPEPAARAAGPGVAGAVASGAAELGAKGASEPAARAADVEPSSAHPGAAGTPGVIAGSSQQEKMALFDGTGGSLGRWRHLGAGSATHEDGTFSLQAGAELGLFYFDERGFDDFRLRLEYRPQQDAQVGFAFRFMHPEHEEPTSAREHQGRAALPIQTGFEVNLGSQRPVVEPGTFNDVLFGKAEGAQLHPQRAEIDSGEWNELELLARGNDYTIRLNGKETAQLTNVDASRGRRAAEVPGAGFLGFLMRAGQIFIRRVELEPLATEAPAPPSRDLGHDFGGSRTGS